MDKEKGIGEIIWEKLFGPPPKLKKVEFRPLPAVNKAPGDVAGVKGYRGPRNGYVFLAETLPNSVRPSDLAEETWSNNTKLQKKHHSTMVRFQALPDSFFIGAHANREALFRYIDANEEGVSPHAALKELQSNAAVKQMINECKYILFLACNTGNELDPADKSPCFARTFANLSGKPCYAPEGFIRLVTVGETEVGSDYNAITNELEGRPLGWKLFLPENYNGAPVSPPKKIFSGGKEGA
ncbi:MAG: hypothetical protein IPN71_01305 [Fibrobacteres bacterium]|nr:hypothetical protein [Fibrobacterota bacterium]